MSAGNSPTSSPAQNRDLTLEQTHIYVGRRSKHVSIFIRNRTLVSVDGRPWPLLEGLLVEHVPPDSKDNHNRNFQLEMRDSKVHN
jgi:hypothetical protein